MLASPAGGFTPPAGKSGRRQRLSLQRMSAKASPLGDSRFMQFGRFVSMPPPYEVKKLFE